MRQDVSKMLLFAGLVAGGLAAGISMSSDAVAKPSPTPNPTPSKKAPPAPNPNSKTSVFKGTFIPAGKPDPVPPGDFCGPGKAADGSALDGVRDETGTVVYPITPCCTAAGAAKLKTETRDACFSGKGKFIEEEGGCFYGGILANLGKDGPINQHFRTGVKMKCVAGSPPDTGTGSGVNTDTYVSVDMAPVLSCNVLDEIALGTYSPEKGDLSCKPASDVQPDGLDFVYGVVDNFNSADYFAQMDDTYKRVVDSCGHKAKGLKELFSAANTSKNIDGCMAKYLPENKRIARTTADLFKNYQRHYDERFAKDPDFFSAEKVSERVSKVLKFNDRLANTKMYEHRREAMVALCCAQITQGKELAPFCPMSEKRFDMATLRKDLEALRASTVNKISAAGPKDLRRGKINEDGSLRDDFEKDSRDDLPKAGVETTAKAVGEFVDGLRERLSWRDRSNLTQTTEAIQAEQRTCKDLCNARVITLTQEQRNECSSRCDAVAAAILPEAKAICEFGKPRYSPEGPKPASAK